MATLYHWDTPLPLEHRGGWLNRSTAERFAEYSAAAGRRFGDRVAQWVTLNEPVSVTLNGYALGVHAPGHDLLFDALPAVHHQLLAHGLAVQALRAEAVTGAVGVTNLHSPVRPASRSLSDRFLARHFRPVLNRVYADPILLGRYPKLPLIARPWFRSLGKISDADLRNDPPAPGLLRTELLLPREGRHRTRSGRKPRGHHGGDAEDAVPYGRVPGIRASRDSAGRSPRTIWGPLLRELKDRYGEALPPLYITESGASFPEPDHVSGPIADADRISYIASHLGHALDATSPGGIAEDVELLGYYVWTLMDNFEWAAGYSQRFGLVHVDFDTQERTPKDSYYWYQALSRARRA